MSLKLQKKIKKNAELCSHFRPKKLKVSVICSKNNQRGKTCTPIYPHIAQSSCSFSLRNKHYQHIESGGCGVTMYQCMLCIRCMYLSIRMLYIRYIHYNIGAEDESCTSGIG